MFQLSLLLRGLSELDRSQWKTSGPWPESILKCCKQAITGLTAENCCRAAAQRLDLIPALRLLAQLYSSYIS
jgi:hypothetical protein